ncbi:MAG: UDP-3-O-(3-hydroxymyristoyl)glucosamine N-acyltransferase [Phycisphaerae bacterium]|jgi:UDP-3-O-[3-hydroxymyristoyl] glucosamine N-acyltransferase|nr:UDP-3-O-(3-hydroxymyristoyl)glucosamine N-acyltransferase [Phycisphaerae bacterium]MDP7287280.1 UDP-3-O-(3-hydroxymyristoyl)glucosamine N-acyltransferase [Phycisphaerae bacterium]
MSEKTLTVREIAQLLGVEVIGADQGLISSMASPDQAGPSDITFAVDKRFASQLIETRAGCAIVSQPVSDVSTPQLVVENVKLAVVNVLGALAIEPSGPEKGIDASARVSPQAQLADDVSVGPGVTIDPGAQIGAGAILHANVSIGADVIIGPECVLQRGVVVLDRCVIGQRVIIGPNSVIGADGFGYETVQGVHIKVPHIGNVIIEDDVEIGACSCVDRAKFGSTIVGAGAKIDNLVQVAHNVKVGKGCVLCAQVGVAGSVKLGDYVVAGGHAGFKDNITVGDQVQCSAFAAVAGDIPAGKRIAGIPAHEARQTLRELRALKDLPDLIKQVRAIEARLESLVQTEDN